MENSETLFGYDFNPHFISTMDDDNNSLGGVIEVTVLQQLPCNFLGTGPM